MSATALSDLSAETMANALAPLMNGGTLNFYSGPQPPNANTALSGNTLLVTLTFGSPAFGNAAAGGTITANAIAPGTAVATGTVTFARILQADGHTVVMDVPVGASGSNAPITINSSAIATGSLIQVTTYAYKVPEQ